MVNLVNTAAGGTAGAAVTTANSGGSAGNAWDFIQGTGAMVFSTNAFQGTYSYHVDGTAGQMLFAWTSSIVPSKKQAFRAYLKMPSYPSAEMQIITPRNSTAYIGGINLTAAGKLKASALGGGILYTTTSTLALNTWYRIEASYEVGTTTTNGVVRFGIYLGSSTTPLETVFTTTTANLGTTDITTWQMGKLPSSNSWEAYWDAIEVDTSTSTFIGPYQAPLLGIRPSSVISNPGGYVNVGGAASLDAAVADESNTTYVETPNAPNAAAITFGPNATLASGTPVVMVTLAASSATPPASAAVALMQGTTVIATRTFSNLPTTPTAYSYTLTTAEAAAITARNDLRWRITATAV